MLISIDILFVLLVLLRQQNLFLLFDDYIFVSDPINCSKMFYEAAQMFLDRRSLLYNKTCFPVCSVEMIARFRQLERGWARSPIWTTRVGRFTRRRDRVESNKTLRRFVSDRSVIWTRHRRVPSRQLCCHRRVTLLGFGIVGSF